MRIAIGDESHSFELATNLWLCDGKLCSIAFIVIVLFLVPLANLGCAYKYARRNTMKSNESHKMTCCWPLLQSKQIYSGKTKIQAKNLLTLPSSSRSARSDR